MNYEEKYKALVNAIKVLQETNPSDIGIRNWVNDNVPELRESEDEKIRKILIDFFKNYKTQEEIGIKTFFGIPTDGIIAWIEKQGEQKSVNYDCNEDERIRKRIILCLEECVHNDIIRDYEKDECIAWLEKQDGRKPAEWSEEDDVMVNDILRCLPSKSRPEYNQRRIDWLKSLKGRVQPQPKQEWKQENREELTEFENVMMHIGDSFFGENAGLDPNDTDTIKEQAELLLELAPKTEWSEEDEKIRQTIINEFEQCSEWCCSNGLTKEDCINWLNRQKYFEWSDEDNENMNSLCVLLDQMVSINAIGNEHSIEYKNWLKSIKQRHTWKPSDEQMEALKEACDKSWEPDGLDPLYMLYEDLKKLKGELL